MLILPKTTVVFLSCHIIGGRSSGPRKIKSILEWPTTKKCKGCKIIYGDGRLLSNVWRKFFTITIHLWGWKVIIECLKQSTILECLMGIFHCKSIDLFIYIFKWDGVFSCQYFVNSSAMSLDPWGKYLFLDFNGCVTSWNGRLSHS